MKAQENTAQEATCKQPLMKRIFRGCNRFLGTLFFTIFMSHNLLVCMGVDTFAPKPLPYFVIFSCFVCVTIGASYWFGDNARRWRSYCISSVITFVFYYIFLVSISSSTNYFVTSPQLVVILSLTVVSAIYSILKLIKIKKINREAALSNTKRQLSRRSITLAKTVRLISLISFCSVFLENAQGVLWYIFDPNMRIGRMYPFSEAFDVIVAAYALWLVICFARKEFVQLGEHAEGEKDCVENA